MSADRSSARVGRRLGLLPALLLLPNAVWLTLDQRLWTSDESWFALQAMRCAHAIASETAGWWETLMSVAPKAPLLPWLGQFFVPLGQLGEMERGLLVLTLASSFATLLLAYGALREVCRDHGAATAGLLVLAASPAFIAVSKSFYVQSLQTAAVAWLAFIMVRAHRWDPVYTLLQLVSAGLFAMLAQLSSPAFCVLPVLAAALESLRRLRGEFSLARRHAPMLLIAGAFCALWIGWMVRNGAEAVAYGEWSFGYWFGGGELSGYRMKLFAWGRLLESATLLSRAYALALLGLVGWALVVRPSPSESRTCGSGFGALLILQLTLPLLLFASSAHQTYRYVLPLVIYLALLVGWSLSRVRRGWVTLAVGILFGVQFVIVQLGQFGVADAFGTNVGPLQVREAPKRSLAVQIGSATSTAERPETVFLATGPLGLYNLNVEFHTAAAVRNLVWIGPRYESVEFLLTGSPEMGVGQDVNVVWETLVAAHPSYVVIPTPEIRRHAREAVGHGWATIVRRTAEIADRVSASAQFERTISPDPEQVEIYRFVAPGSASEAGDECN